MAGNWFWRAEATLGSCKWPHRQLARLFGYFVGEQFISTIRAPGRQGEQPRPPVEHAYALFGLGPPARNIVTTWSIQQACSVLASGLSKDLVDVIALLCDRNVWRKEMLSLV
uniref:Uncharacterized protein n=1 Tax=Oryza barthii TaxID=65489 RepID=A0A0D3H3C4_9ORYZ